MSKKMGIGEIARFGTASSADEYEGTVLGIEPIKTGAFEGALVDFNIEDYGLAKVLFFEDVVTAENISFRASRSGIPSQFSGTRWEDFKWSMYGEGMRNSREFSIVRKFVSDNNFFRERNKGLYIWGKIPGCGKTMLGCMLANEILHKHIFSVRYIEQRRYLELMRSDEQRAKEEAKATRECILLFLDNFGKCKSDWQKETVTNLIEYRNRQGHITVYMSSNSPDKVQLDENAKANDLIYASTVGIQLPDVPIRARLTRQEGKAFEEELLRK